MNSAQKSESAKSRENDWNLSHLFASHKGSEG